MNNPNFQSPWLSANPANMNGQDGGNPPTSSNGDLQQLGSSQTSYVNQFLNDNQPSDPVVSQQSPSTYIPTPISAPAPPQPSMTSGPVINPTFGNGGSSPMSTLPKLEDGDDFVLPAVPPMNSQAPNAFVASPDRIEPGPSQQNIPMAPVMQPSMPNVPSQEIGMNATALNQQQTDPLANVGPTSMPSTQQATPIQASPQILGNNENQNIFAPPPLNIPVTQAPIPTTDTGVIGTHQVTINEDYADFYNRQQQSYQGPIEPRHIDFSHPATNLRIDQDFSDGMPLNDNSGVSSGFLTPFDDNSDDSLLPVVGNDDPDEDFTLDNANPASSYVPYGFSDFDPNEQDTGLTEDHLASFESRSLEDTADKIDVDYSENIPTASRQQNSVNVLTTEPIGQNPQTVVQNVPVQTMNYYPQPMATTMDSTYISRPVVSSPMPISQTVEPANAELSPAARLNQLLEAEEAAEKVVMEKQNQVLNTSTGKNATTQSKLDVFKQLDPDRALDNDLKSQMSPSKANSRYFLIFSVIIIISIIGFLLVLLGLMLLNN